MTDKIYELIQQSEVSISHPRCFTGYIDINKFTELIVRECLAQVDKVDTMLEDDKEKTGVAWVGLAIAKHFGVEE